MKTLTKAVLVSKECAVISAKKRFERNMNLTNASALIQAERDLAKAEYNLERTAQIFDQVKHVWGGV